MSTQFDFDPFDNEPAKIQPYPLTAKREMVVLDEGDKGNYSLSFESKPATPEEEDYPILISPDLSRADLMEMCEKYQLDTVSTKMKTKAIITKLKGHMKKIHPIHKYISGTSLPQLKMLHSVNEDEESLSENDLPMTIANFYFKQHFESPSRSFLKDMKQLELKSASIELDPSQSPDLKDEQCQEIPIPKDENKEKDFSILTIPSHLTELELKQLCIKHHFGQDFYQKTKTPVIEKELQAKLKSNHPIISYLMKMSTERLHKLYSVHGKPLLTANVENKALCKELMEIYFAKHPLSPLTSLISDEKSIDWDNLKEDEQDSDIQDSSEEEDYSDIQDVDEEDEDSEKTKTESSEGEEEIDDMSEVEENDNDLIEDYPVLQMPTKLFREDLKKKFQQLHLHYSSNLSKSAMSKRLDTFLKDCHPIHDYIANLPYDQLIDIHKSFSTDPSAADNIADLPSAIANHYFKQHHFKPLASLKQTIETMEEIDDLMQPIKKIKLPSIILDCCDFEDCSIEFPMEWSKAEIISELDRHGIPIAYYYKKDIAKAKAKLAAILKKDHPIHNIISKLSYKEVSALTLFTGGVPSFSSDMDIARSKLANICFEKQPNSPIMYLKTLTGNFENLPQKEKKRLLQKYQEEMKKKIENELQC